jgi:hypothetical protein
MTSPVVGAPTFCKEKATVLGYRTPMTRFNMPTLKRAKPFRADWRNQGDRISATP